MNSAPQIDFFVAGGTLKPDAPSYIPRRADDELFDHLIKGDFCYILTPRQMGKSSLVARTIKRLQDVGTKTAYIELTQIDAKKSKKAADAWYRGIARFLSRQLGLSVDLQSWWNERRYLGPLQILMEFIEEILLGQIDAPVAIFIDEIDSTIPLPFSDDFFAAIRSCYNMRAVKPAFNRLTFVMIGCASPSDLIKDNRRTPFNIGHSIALADFGIENAKPLAAGLAKDRLLGEALLQRILHWTDGHPYLTQKFCSAVAAEQIESYNQERVDKLAEQLFLKPEASRTENNLKFVRDRIVTHNWFMVQVLKLYHRIVQHLPVVEDPISPLHNRLKLSGLVKTNPSGHLAVRNAVYRRVFNEQWLRKEIRHVYNKMIFRSLPAGAVVMVSLFYFLLLPLFTRSVIDPLAANQRIQQLRLQFVPIPAGQFEMGDHQGVGYDNELPLHVVRLDSFLMSRYEISNQQYSDFLNADAAARDSAAIWLDLESGFCQIDRNGNYFSARSGFEEHPVVTVSWFGAAAFARWLSRELKAVYRLPTEAEWEYACRAGTITPFNTGDCLSTDQANYDGNFPYQDCPSGRYIEAPTRVGSYPPNAWGLYDMHGNVYEWCFDWYARYDNQRERQEIAKNPKGPETGSIRVARGGSWIYGARICRSAYRNYSTPGNRGIYLGFRLVFVPQ